MEPELGDIQAQFAEIIWERETVGSGELVKICEKELNWKKSTTYTVLRKLCEKGLFRNEGGIVTSVCSRDEYYSARSGRFVEELFGGSLPAFIASFASGKKLSRGEIDEIQGMIDEFRREK